MPLFGYPKHRLRRSANELVPKYRFGVSVNGKMMDAARMWMITLNSKITSERMARLDAEKYGKIWENMKY
jgi:hypothetical protein